MRKAISFSIVSLLLVLLLLSPEVQAVTYDYLDVTPGYETLNLAISTDVPTPNRVYRLQRGGVYLTNGTIETTPADGTLRIFAAEGEGALPMILTTADEGGQNYRAFRLIINAHYKDIYVSGRSNLGIYTNDGKDMMRMQEVGIKVVVENCFLEHEWKDFFRMNAKDQKLFVSNTIMRNAGDLADASDNQYIDTRSNDQDSIVVTNCTMHTNTGRIFRSAGTGGTYFRNLIMDHCTFYQVGNGDGARGRVNETTTYPVVDARKAKNVSVTNCLFIDVNFHGDEINTFTVDDTLDCPIFGFSPIDVEGLTDADRTIVLKNNMWGVTPALAAYYASVDSIKGPVFLNNYSLNTFFNVHSSWVTENNVEGVVEFTDAPTADLIIASATYRRQNNFIEDNVPEFWADKNGIGDTPDTWGPAADEWDFSYPTTSAAYTAGTDGLPLGDLNWFPEVSAVKNNKSRIPAGYALEQNYPNPFNPSTSISYTVPKATQVSLTIFDEMGRQVTELIQNEFQAAGSHQVTWNGRDMVGNTVPSGVYVYQLRVDNMLFSQKMLLMK